MSSLFGISAALGAFVGGMLMHASQATEWISQTLHSFRIIFVAIFFNSVMVSQFMSTEDKDMTPKKIITITGMMALFGILIKTNDI